MPMIDRRRFLKSIIAAAASPAAAAPNAKNHAVLGPLRADPAGLLDLPAGFSYRVVSRAGDTMSDELTVPPAHDGMAAFEGENGRIVLVCNHEMRPLHPQYSAFGTAFESLPERVRQRVYDHGGGRTPGAGGTTTTIFNPETGRRYGYISHRIN